MDDNPRLKLVAGPSAEPVTLAEAKLYCRVEVDDDDALMTRLIVAARRLCEAEARRAFVAQTWDQVLDCFPAGGGYFNRAIRESGYGPRWLPSAGGGIIDLIRTPVASVASVKYYDQAGTLQTIDPALYQVSTGTPGRVAPMPASPWPITQPGRLDAVVVRYVAGEASASAVPESIKVAILMSLAAWYDNREAFAAGGAPVELPRGARDLVAAEGSGLYA